MRPELRRPGSCYVCGVALTFAEGVAGDVCQTCKNEPEGGG